MFACQLLLCVCFMCENKDDDEWESHGNPMGMGQELNKTWE